MTKIFDYKTIDELIVDINIQQVERDLQQNIKDKEYDTILQTTLTFLPKDIVNIISHLSVDTQVCFTCKTKKTIDKYKKKGKDKYSKKCNKCLLILTLNRRRGKEIISPDMMETYILTQKENKTETEILELYYNRPHYNGRIDTLNNQIRFIIDYRDKLKTLMLKTNF